MPSGDGPFTLAIDIGGTNMKASVLDDAGVLTAERIRCPTPKPATPASVLDSIVVLASQLPSFDRISIGFPGVVKAGTVITAPNLGTESWSGFRLIEALVKRFKSPARILNDAAVQGLGVVQGPGLECTITLGTGIGCAVFRNRRLLLPLEFGQHLRGNESYDQFIGQAARDAVGAEAWNERVRRCIPDIFSLTTCDVLYVGGGNARNISFPLPENVRVVSNSAGVTGGVRLWEPALDELFTGESSAWWPARQGRAA
jgi:polyphosphate glucokinase